ncbi:MAG: hypothetical protein V4521_11845 [Pseudomonadota bacterium]
MRVGESALARLAEELIKQAIKHENANDEFGVVGRENVLGGGQ